MMTMPRAKKTPAASPPLRLTDIRAAYRLLHTYHQSLFALLARTRDAVTAHIGDLPHATWGSYPFDLPPRKTTDPTLRPVFEFVPLAHAHFSWATAEKPRPGALQFTLVHGADTALDAMMSRRAPDPARLAPPEASQSTLSVHLKAIPPEKRRVDLGDWERVDALIANAPRFQKDLWYDARIHTTEAAGISLRFGGFERDMAELDTPAAVDARLVKPLITLIDTARAE